MISKYVRFYLSWRAHHGVIPSIKRVWWKIQQDKRLRKDVTYLRRRLRNGGV